MNQPMIGATMFLNFAPVMTQGPKQDAYKVFCSAIETEFARGHITLEAATNLAMASMQFAPVLDGAVPGQNPPPPVQ